MGLTDIGHFVFLLNRVARELDSSFMVLPPYIAA